MEELLMDETELEDRVKKFAEELGITGWRVGCLLDTVRDIMQDLELYHDEFLSD